MTYPYIDILILHEGPVACSGAIAIGVGAATAVFSAVDPLLFRPLPYPRGDRLVSVGFLGPVDNNEFHLANSYLEWREKQTPFQAMTSMMSGGLCDLDTPTPRQVNCIRVESNFLKTLGIAPALGRDFAREEDRFNGPRVGLLSFGLWRDAFGANPATVSQTIDLDEQPVRVIGILPAGFKMPQGADPDILLLEQWDEHVARAPDSTIFLRAFARLKDGLSLEQARARLAPLFQESVARYVPAALGTETEILSFDLYQAARE